MQTKNKRNTNCLTGRRERKKRNKNRLNQNQSAIKLRYKCALSQYNIVHTNSYNLGNLTLK